MCNRGYRSVDAMLNIGAVIPDLFGSVAVDMVCMDYLLHTVLYAGNVSASGVGLPEDASTGLIRAGTAGGRSTSIITAYTVTSHQSGNSITENNSYHYIQPTVYVRPPHCV